MIRENSKNQENFLKNLRQAIRREGTKLKQKGSQADSEGRGKTGQYTVNPRASLRLRWAGAVVPCVKMQGGKTNGFK